MNSGPEMEDRLKFCMITTFYPPYHFGGDAMYIYRLTNELARRGHSVDVIHCEDSYTALQTGTLAAGFDNHPNVRTHRLKSGFGALSPLLTQQTGMPFFKRKQILKVLGTADYDVIHYHNMSLIGITALRYGRAVKLYTTHEHWLVCPMHVLWKFDREVCSERSCTRCQLIGRRPPQLWRHTTLLEKMLRHVDCFISPSRFTLKKQLDLGLNVPIVHIPYFLPQASEERTKELGAAPRRAGARPYFLFVGRLEKIKGLQTLFPVFTNRTGYDLMIAGAGEYEEELRTLAGGAGNIHFLGRLSQNRLQQLYRDAVSVIVPSICYETFGIIIIEAFSMKTPVIVNNLGALPEVVEDSGGGLIYSDAEGLVSAMDAMAASEALRDELGRKGYAAYLQLWTEDVHMRQYLSLVDRLRRERRKAPSSAAGDATDAKRTLLHTPARI